MRFLFRSMKGSGMKFSMAFMMWLTPVRFQDGHIDYDELDAFFTVNKKLADKYGMKCWTNAETFDRDMPIDFLPIKFDKLRMKLEAAKRAGYDKAITFEFSHFMSPQSAYLPGRTLV